MTLLWFLSALPVAGLLLVGCVLAALGVAGHPTANRLAGLGFGVSLVTLMGEQLASCVFPWDAWDITEPLTWALVAFFQLTGLLGAAGLVLVAVAATAGRR